MAAPSDANEIYLSSSPHFTKGLSTRAIMFSVIVALLPECIFGVILFGVPALANILCAVISAVVFEALFQKFTKQPIRIFDLSAVVTGILLALVLPPTTPLWQTALGSLFAVVVAKGMFGGIGQNPFNPALTGRAFLFVSFPETLGAQWLLPKQIGSDAISSATILSKVEEGAVLPEWQNVKEYFLGITSGCIGETCAILILLAFLFLLVTKIIDWRAPVSMIFVIFIATFFTSLAKGKIADQCLCDAVFAIVSGGALFGAVFMTTDYSTAPVTQKGRVIFGAGCGAITYLIRTFGGYPEGVMFSILIMNCFAPFLNNLTAKKYGFVKTPKNGGTK